MAFAQAAVFLIRLTKASPTIHQVVALDPAVASHYLTMSVDLLELGDKSETRLSTYFARTIRGISCAAGLAIRPDDVREEQPAPEQPPMSLDNGLYNADTFWAGHDLFDLSCVLGSGVAPDTDWLDFQDLSTTPSWDVMLGAGDGSV